MWNPFKNYPSTQAHSGLPHQRNLYTSTPSALQMGLSGVAQVLPDPAVLGSKLEQGAEPSHPTTRVRAGTPYTSDWQCGGDSTLPTT